MSEKPLLICVVGPTAIGKTTLAIQIAKHFTTEIISSDSRQFYKEMAIGTAVPSKEELVEITHHFIQYRSIFEEYSVGDFERDALKLLDTLFETNNVIVMVGGSGLYIDAVIKGLDKFPEVPVNIIEDLKTEFETQGIVPLQKELLEKDPNYYKKVDLQNHHRIIRALGVCRSQKHPYSSFLNTGKEPRKFKTLCIGLTAERAIIYKRINQRVDIMMNEGLENEARNLYPNKELNALQTVGYRELFNYFDGEYTKEFAIEEIKKNTRRFAKRQGTWFRKNASINWFDYKTNFSEIINKISNAQTK